MTIDNTSYTRAHIIVNIRKMITGRGHIPHTVVNHESLYIYMCMRKAITSKTIEYTRIYKWSVYWRHDNVIGIFYIQLFYHCETLCVRSH